MRRLDDRPAALRPDKTMAPENSGRYLYRFDWGFLSPELAFETLLETYPARSDPLA